MFAFFRLTRSKLLQRERIGLKNLLGRDITPPHELRPAYQRGPHLICMV